MEEKERKLREKGSWFPAGLGTDKIQLPIRTSGRGELNSKTARGLVNPPPKALVSKRNVT